MERVATSVMKLHSYSRARLGHGGGGGSGRSSRVTHRRPRGGSTIPSPAIRPVAAGRALKDDEGRMTSISAGAVASRSAACTHLSQSRSTSLHRSRFKTGTPRAKSARVDARGAPGS